jgi:hypothetical protein
MLERKHKSLSPAAGPRLLTWFAVIGKCTGLVVSFSTVYSSGFASTYGFFSPWLTWSMVDGISSQSRNANRELQ